MRGTVPGLVSVAPVAQRLPAVYQEDEFLQRFVQAFDVALAPLFLTLDTLECYVDPALAPPDFLAWLGEWVGIEVDDTWSDQRRREIIAGRTPLGRILINHNVLRHIDLGAILQITAGPGLAAALAMPVGNVTYGRLATIFCDHQPAVDLLEISAPLPGGVG